MVFFKNFLFNQFSDYFHREDTYKNSEGEGLLQRYTQIFGDELDEQIIPSIEDFYKNLDVLNCDEQTLKYLSDFLGTPPDLFLNTDIYRKILSNIISIYKIKGTVQSYEIFFKLMGFNIIIEDEEFRSFNRYDTNLRYDSGLVYDAGCKKCYQYSITFSSIDNPLEPINQATLQKLSNVVKFVEPINAKLKSLGYFIPFKDDVNFCIEQDIKFETLSLARMDTGLLYDMIGLNYDKEESNVLLTLPFDCNQSLPEEGISIWAIEDDFIVSE
jgi:hypothetical protein